MYTKMLGDTLGKVVEQSPSFFMHLVERHFRGMKEGQLTLEDRHSGKTIVFGQGAAPRARMIIHEPIFWRKLVMATDIGLAESYMDGDWDSDDCGLVIRWFIANVKSMPSMSGGQVLRNLLVGSLAKFHKMQHFLNQNTIHGSRKNIHEHYDLGNDFFASFLDQTMTYSSGIFASESDSDLEASQFRKLQKLAETAGVQKHHRVLEIGTGWGEFSCFLAEHYGCEVDTLTISEQQYVYAKQKIKERGLGHKIRPHLSDYRQWQGEYDRVFTVEMLEAVGHEFLPQFFACCERWLKPAGKMVHQIILSPDSRYEEFRKGVDFIQKYIFPGSLLPSVTALLNAANQDQREFVMMDYLDMGLDYAKTLALWRRAFDKNWPSIEKQGFDQSFRRKWLYYFHYCEAAFAMRNITVAQLSLVRPNQPQLS